MRSGSNNFNYFSKK